MFKKSPLKATRLAKRKRRIFIWKIIAGIVGVILVFSAIVGVTHLKFFQIDTISVSGNSGVDSTSITILAAHDLQNPYLHLFSKYNRFIYPKYFIINDLLHTYPRLQSVSMNVKGHSLNISVSERDPSYIWCAGMPNDDITQGCYFMDTSGYIFSEAPIFSGHAFFAYYGIVGTTSPITSHYLSSSMLLSVKKINEYLIRHGIVPYALVAKDDSSFELYFGNNSKILFESDEDADNIILNIETLMNDPKVFSTTGTSTLDYLDLRFGNKIYYRQKNSGDNSAASGM